MKQKKTGQLLFSALGALIALGGFFLMFMPDRTNTAIPYIMIGVGCGLFGHQFGAFLAHRAEQRDPVMAKRLRVEAEDERNQEIVRRAKAAAFELTAYVFGLLCFIFLLMGEGARVILPLVGGYFFLTGYSIWQQVRLQKKI